MPHPRSTARFCIPAAVLLAVVVLLALAAPALAFPDVPAGHPYETAIDYLSSEGIIGGYGNGNFGLNDTVKRAQFAKMIVGTLAIDPGTSTVTRFTDLGTPDANGYPHRYVQAAYEAGITFGTNAAQTLFSPWNAIRRDQVISMIVRGIENLYPGILLDPPPGTTTFFADVPEPHGSNVRIAEYNGLLYGLIGMGPGWSVTATATRGEVAQMLWNLIPAEAWVYTDGSGDFPTLEAAVAGVGPHTTIHLGPGTFTLTKTLELAAFPLILEGNGAGGTDRTTVRYAGTVVDVGWTVFIARDIRFESTATSAGSNVVNVVDASVSFDSCHFAGANRGDTGTGYGLHAEGASRVVVSSSIFTLNDWGGVSVEGTTEVMLENNATAGGQNGIALRGSSTGTIRGNTCSLTEATGIGASGDSVATIENNTCSNNSADGISLDGSARATVRGNTCNSNTANGIWVAGDADATIEDNDCLDNLEFGIRLLGNAIATIRGNTCRSTGLSGIGLVDSADATIENNQCSGSKQCGIALFNNATATIRGNTCNANGVHGIALLDDSSALVEGNTCKSNVQAGIAFAGRSSGTARNNECAGNKWGIAVASGATPTIGTNNLHGNTVDLYYE
jgi:parallel beta-helix repeat protein